MKKFIPPLKIGWALSGGGARGLAHIGVIKKLLQAGIHPYCITGTSMGGIIAAAYALGHPIAEIESQALRLSKPHQLIKLLDISSTQRGLMEGNRVRAYIRNWLGEQHTFENLTIPLALNAIDLLSAQEITLRNGPLLPAVLATCTVPGLFAPYEIGPYRLVDGGVLNNLPVRQAYELGAEFVIAINVQTDPRLETPQEKIPLKIQWPFTLPEFFMDFYWAELIMVSELTKHQIERYPPDIEIYPKLSSEITMFLGFPRAPEIIIAGEKAAEEALPQILSALKYKAG
jgi:NTE family protein